MLFRSVTRQIAQGFRIDRDGNVHGLVQSLMEEPIRNAELLIGRLGPAQINAEGRKFCVEYGGLTKKYPFNTTSTSDASLDEVDSIFRPIDGKLAVLYEVSLKNYLDRQAGQFVRKPDARVKITDNFLRFFNRAMSFSTALYRGESRSAKLTYAMKALPADGLRGITLNLDEIGRAHV